MEKRRVLIVEDDEDNIALVAFILQRAGYATLKATDGRQALEMARRERPDLVLMDMTMPEMDGWTAAEHLKNDPATQDILVVALTVRSMPNDKIRAIDAGCDGYLTKPMNVKNFVKQVASFIETLEA
jgi:two-component system, cell cycle response regulator DivK